ncbi:T9SS type A sorting domain-containing protein [Chryseobacterium sp. MP_3.2]|uniref:T9SS type A sorting domain-containing protein n=1 Tax=Chryseobacterium sp. MP_3.2 TaxID=3071712 RepID=UPI002E03AB5F|nr:hypothetical protein [Chryseobacterium sp. MP_3.2]
MKKIYSLFAAVIVAATVNAQTATQVVNENFSFTGALNANGWATHSGTAGQLLSDGNAAKLVAGNSEDVNKAFTTSYSVEAGKKNEANYSATINIANATGLTTAGDYFLMFGSTAGSSVTSFFARLYVKGSATGYTLGILNNSSAGALPTYGTELPYGTAANIVVNYTIDNTLATPTNVATLQVNAQSLLTNSSGTSAAPTTLASVAIREAGNATIGTGNISIDNLSANTISATTLAASVVNATKSNLVKNTIVGNTIMFAAKADVQLVNMNGQIVKTASVNENTSLEVATLPKGTYIVTGIVNGKTVSQKIIKK